MSQVYRNKLRLRPLVLAIAALSCAGAQAATVSAWAPTATKSYVNNHPASATAQAVEMPSGTAVHIAVSLKLRNKAALDALTANIRNGATQTLTPAQFMTQFGPTQAQADAVVAHLTASGFRNITVAPNRMLVTADGNAATVKAAFNTTLKATTQNGKQAYVNETDAMVPQALADVVLAIHGLQTAETLHSLAVTTPRAAAKLQSLATTVPIFLPSMTPTACRLPPTPRSPSSPKAISPNL
jgi:pseudomonalisin/xanthomonalisin